MFPSAGALPLQPPSETSDPMTPANSPRLVLRDGVAYVEGCNLPIWRLEMGRRAGSRPEAQIAVTLRGRTRRHVDGTRRSLSAARGMKYLTVKQVLAIHARSIEQFEGDPAIRDPGLLDSAVAHPRAGFGGKDLYPDLVEKAAALSFSLVMNHPFADGTSGQATGPC